MIPRCSAIPIVAAGLALAACAEPLPAPPRASAAPSFSADKADRNTIVVNPEANGNGTARTIQEGIDRVAAGGTVKIRPGTYDETLVIAKGLTLEPIGEGSGSAVLQPSGRPQAAIEVTATEPVVIRDLTVRHGGAEGVRGRGAVDLTLDGVSITAVSPPLGPGNLVSVTNDARVTDGRRARFVMRNSKVDGAVTRAMTEPSPPSFPQNFGVRVIGDVTASVVGNEVRRTGGACIFVQLRVDLGGETNADVENNDLDECYPIGRAGAILIGSAGGPVRVGTPFSAVGVVNVVGNTIRNTTRSCFTGTGISFESLEGRIERNTIVDVVQLCALSQPQARNLPAGIWIGSRPPVRNLPPAAATVRYNDIVGNAQAGLRIGSNQTTPTDARCNWWGSADGPPAFGANRILVESGGAAPVVAPHARKPIAATGETC
ncbi:MAG: hypothetical protein ABR499_18020 [Gemmatimonadaceae bacterium]